MEEGNSVCYMTIGDDPEYTGKSTLYSTLVLICMEGVSK
jgi:hypothetical protein